MGENFQINQINQLPSACFPSLKYLQHCGAEKHFFIESKETYPKQTLRNRYLVNGANSPILLTIPVRKPNGSKTITEDIEIDCSTNWQKVHIETLKTAYNNSPYFEHYLYELNHFFDFKNSKLIDWNNRVLAWLNNHLKLNLIFENNPIFQLEKLEQFPETFLIKNNDLPLIKSLNELEDYWSILHHLFEQGPIIRKKIIDTEG